MWFLPTAQTATLPWRVSDHVLEPGGGCRVGTGTMNVVLKHEKVRNTDKTAALARLVTSDFDQRALSLWSNVCVCACVRVHVSLTHTNFKHNLSPSLVFYFSLPVSLSFFFCLCGIASFHRVSELHPLPALPVLQKQDYLATPREAGIFLGWSH